VRLAPATDARPPKLPLHARQLVESAAPDAVGGRASAAAATALEAAAEAAQARAWALGLYVALGPGCGVPEPDPGSYLEKTINKVRATRRL
jgi:hypothetical protein